MTRRPPRSTLFPPTPLFRSRGRLGPPRLRRGAKPLEHGPGGGAVLFIPDRVRVRERLAPVGQGESRVDPLRDRKSTRLNSSHVRISYAVFCLKKKKNTTRPV